MYHLLSSADNKTPTSPRRVITSIGFLYREKLASQQIMRNNISDLEDQLAHLRLENLHFKTQLEKLHVPSERTQTQLNTEPTNLADNLRTEESRYQQTNHRDDQVNYHSIESMVHRYQEPID